MKTYFKLACVYCSQPIECAGDLVGRQTKCPGCQSRIVVPAPKGQLPKKQPLTKFT